MCKIFPNHNYGKLYIDIIALLCLSRIIIRNNTLCILSSSVRGSITRSNSSTSKHYLTTTTNLTTTG